MCVQTSYLFRVIASAFVVEIISRICDEFIGYITFFELNIFVKSSTSFSDLKADLLLWFLFDLFA